MSDKITKRTAQDKELLKNKSVYSLPDNPSNKGFSASQLKSKIADPSFVLYDWLTKLIEDTSDGFDDLEEKLEDVYTKEQTDYFLGLKQDLLVSGTNIKTINGESILGSGNLYIQGGGVGCPSFDADLEFDNPGSEDERVIDIDMSQSDLKDIVDNAYPLISLHVCIDEDGETFADVLFKSVLSIPGNLAQYERTSSDEGIVEHINFTITKDNEYEIVNVQDIKVQGDKEKNIGDFLDLFNTSNIQDILEHGYDVIHATLLNDYDGSEIPHGLQWRQGTYTLRLQSSWFDKSTYAAFDPVGQSFVIEFSKDEQDDYSAIILEASYNGTAGSQATSTVIIDALHNLNGRAMTRYTENAHFGDFGQYRIIQILRSGNPLDFEEAKNYMRAMTGSSFVPVYNYYRPQNSLFVMANGTFWKPQWDSTNGLLLYGIPNPYELSANKVTTLNSQSTDAQYPSAKAVYDNLVEVREVAEGKCQTLVSPRFTYGSEPLLISDINSDSHNPRTFALYNPLSKQFENATDNFSKHGNHYQDKILNYLLESENVEVSLRLNNFDYQSVLLFTSVKGRNTGAFSGYDYYAFTSIAAIVDFLNLGDIILLEKIDVPDRWVSAKSTRSSNVSVSFAKLETSKVDLTNYVDLTSPQTIKGVKTIQNELDFKYDNNSTSLWKLKAGGDYSFGFEKDNASLLSYITTQGFGFDGDVYSQNNQDLGKSTSKWKDLYLSGKVDFGTKISGRTATAYIDSDPYDGVRIYSNGSKSATFYDNGVFIDTKLLPNTATTDLGDSSHKWRDLYLSGKAYFNNNYIYEDSNVFKIFINTSERFELTQNTLRPVYSGNLHLGSSSQRIGDTYLSGTVDIHNANTTYGYTILENDYSNLEINFNGSRKFAINNNNGCECRNTFHPGANDTYDLGETDHAWRDAYLTRKSYFAEDGVTHTLAERNWYVYHNQYNELVIGRTYNSVAADKIAINGGTIYTKDNNGNLGAPSNKWANGYFNGQVYAQNTYNFINATDIVNNTLTQAQYDLVTNGKPTLIVGSYNGTRNPLLLSLESTSGVTIARGFYVYSNNLGTFFLNTSTRELGFPSSSSQYNSINNIYAVNGKAIPAYPSSPANAKVLTYGTNNQLSWEDAGGGGSSITIERYI